MCVPSPGCWHCAGFSIRFITRYRMQELNSRCFSSHEFLRRRQIQGSHFILELSFVTSALFSAARVGRPLIRLRYVISQRARSDKRCLEGTISTVYEACTEFIQPFWISREPVTWPWCNLAPNQRRPYCASMNSHCTVGLVSWQWDAVDWAYVMYDRHIHKSPPFQRRF